MEAHSTAAEPNSNKRRAVTDELLKALLLTRSGMTSERSTLDRLCFKAYIVDMADLLGTFEQVVLLSVVGLGNEAYGRSVLRKVQSIMSNRVVSAGAVYATLDRLENQGLLSSHLAEGGPARGGRPRRYYHLTIDGASALTEARTALENMWRGKPWPLEVFA